MRRSRRAQAAFTLTEVIMALAVLAIGLGFVYGRTVDLARAGNDRADTLRARWLARAELSRLQAIGFEPLRAWTPGGWTEIPDAEGFRRSSRVSPRPDGLIELTVAVAWDPPPAAEEAPAGPSVTLSGVVAP